jgi:hypothetical protein
MGQKWYQSKAYDFPNVARYFLKNVYGFCPFKFKETLFLASYKTLEWRFWIEWRALINCLMPYRLIRYNGNPVEWRYGINVIPYVAVQH